MELDISLSAQFATIYSYIIVKTRGLELQSV